MTYHEQQQREINTIKDRTITLKLSDADCDRIAYKAGAVGMSVGELLAEFIGDLVDGTYSNGSDERMYAEQWFERCGFGAYAPGTLLKYLLGASCPQSEAYGVVDGFIAEADEIARYENNPDEYDEDEKDDLLDISAEHQERIQGFLEWRNSGESVDIESEYDICRKWLRDRDGLLK